jgi:hypothetical protein
MRSSFPITLSKAVPHPAENAVVAGRHLAVAGLLGRSAVVLALALVGVQAGKLLGC